MDEAPGSGKSGDETNFRSRRAHKKSRNGCTKCKDRRIKCDEARPRCSRCEKMDLSCQYPKARSGPPAPGDPRLGPADRGLAQLEVPRSEEGVGVGTPESFGHSSTIAGSPLSSASSHPPAQSLLALPRRTRRLDSALFSQAAQALTPAELDLFSHYLEHTSQDLTVDDDDQYTLQVGIPSLACQSKPLMSSVLAIAAVCKCCDVISQPAKVSPEARGQVQELLVLSHRYHLESLHEIQATLPEAKHYDHVLANAALMGMYGSGSHRIRIWLAKTATFDAAPQGGFALKHSQWVSLFRAVRLAYDGLLRGAPGMDKMTALNAASSPASSAAGGSLQLQYESPGPSQAKPSNPSSNHALYSILAATVGQAMGALREKARDVAFASSSGDTDLQACFNALGLFTGIVHQTFSPDDSRPSTPGHNQATFEIDMDPAGPLAQVSPWLRRYTASITSTIPSRLPRRTIMAFIHKTPTRYLAMVGEMIGLIQTDGDETVWTSPLDIPPEPSMAHQLALEIFAHWLVLVILLDNVWWIGDIGAWELRGIVSFWRQVRWRMRLWSKDEDWWPESMFEISRQFDKHRARGGG